MRAIEYVRPSVDVRRRLPLRYVLSLYGISVGQGDRALCPWHGDSNPSLEVYTCDDGTHERWMCFPCRALGLEPSGGDVFSLIMRAESLSFGIAIERARAILRAAGDSLPEPQPARERPELDGSVWEPQLEWAAEEAARRPAELEAAAGFGPGWAPHLVRWGWGLSEDGWALIPHRALGGRLTGIKLRPPVGREHASVEGSRYRQLYGSWLPVTDSLIWCEGETDAIFAAAHLPEFTVRALPGAGYRPTVEELHQAHHAQRAILVLDGDQAGRAAMARLLEIAPFFKAVTLPDGTDLRTCGLPLRELITC